MVCTSLEELRELISKTEDELDELESTKKRLVGDDHNSVERIYSHAPEPSVVGGLYNVATHIHTF